MSKVYSLTQVYTLNSPFGMLLFTPATAYTPRGVSPLQPAPTTDVKTAACRFVICPRVCASLSELPELLTFS
jgi:hypothetical protein